MEIENVYVCGTELIKDVLSLIFISHYTPNLFTRYNSLDFNYGY